MKNALEAKAKKVLDTLARYDGVVMTRRDFLIRGKALGYRIEISTKPRIEFNRIKFNRMTNYKEQEIYEQKCNEMIPDYRLYSEKKSFWSITKTEYDFFNSLT